MPTAPVKGLQGHAGYPSTFLPARKRFSRNQPLQQRRDGVFPSVACSRDGARWRTMLKAQEPEQVLRSCKALCGNEDFVDPLASTSFIDVVNAFRISHTLPEQLKLTGKECKEREKALQQCGRNFVDGIIQYVSSEKEYYRFIIIACKENTNMIMELGFISCCNRDDILNGLEMIEDYIAKGKFEWRENKDVRSNIVEALVERVGEPARKLDSTISQYIQKLTILRLWLHDSVDKMVTQIKNLQVDLVLLALRNWGFVLPRLFEHTDWILLGELILSKVELLERDVSRLHSCENKIDSTLLITFPLGSADGCLDRLSDDGSHLLQNAVINFVNMVISNVAIDISTLEQEFSYWISFRFLMPNDKVRESFSLLTRHVSDLGMLTSIRKGALPCSDMKDPCQRFLAVYVIVQQVLKETTDFVKIVSFNHEKVQSSQSIGYIKTSGCSDVRMVKVRDKDQNENKKDEGVMAATQVFRSRSDEAMKRLIDWLSKHQTGESPLKFCQLQCEVE